MRKNNASIPFEASITFSPFLRFNDGLMENLLAEKEKISKEAACEAVRKFAEDLRASIAEKRPFYIDSLGAFYADEHGAVQFIYAETKQDASRKVHEAVSKAEGYSMPLLDDVEKADADAAFVEEAKEHPEAMASAKPASAAKPETLPPDGAPESHAQQLEAASNSLQQWMEKRSKDVATSAKGAALPEEGGEPGAAPGAAGNAAQPPAEQAHSKPPAPQDEEPEDSLPHAQAYPEAEAKRHRDEERARALEKARSDRAKAQEARKAHEAAQPFGANTAPITPGVWEKDVMGKGKSTSSGIFIFLGVIAFAFIAGMFVLLYRPSMLDFFGSGEADMVEAAPLSAAPAKAENLQNPAPVRRPDAYYVVVGVFNFEDNARRIAQKLYDTKNLKSEVVQTHDGKFAVCLGKYDSKDAALQGVGKYRKRHISAWVVR